MSGLRDKMLSFTKAMTAGEAALDAIAETLEGMEAREKMASAMTAVSMIATDVAMGVAEATGKPPREVAQRIFDSVMRDLPETPEPEVEQPAKPRPAGYRSPWGFE